MRAARSVLALGIGALLGCSAPDPLELPPLQYFTERTAIAVLDDHPPCAGDLAALDAHVEELEQLTGLRRSEPIDIYLGTPEACDEGDRACYRPDLDVIFSPWQSIRHELAHAVERQEIDFASDFWSEGFAVVGAGASSTESLFETLSVDDLSGERELINYAATGHFARYLVETRGWQAYRAILEDGIEDALGQSPQSLVDEYEREAPAAYPPRHPCPYPVLQPDDTGWTETFSFSCETPDATQYENLAASGTRGAAMVRSVVLEAGTYTFELQGGSELVLLGCLTEELVALPEPPSNGDVWNEVDQGQGQPFEAGISHTLTVTRGTYRIAISSNTEDEATMELRIRRID